MEQLAAAADRFVYQEAPGVPRLENPAEAMAFGQLVMRMSADMRSNSPRQPSGEYISLYMGDRMAQEAPAVRPSPPGFDQKLGIHEGTLASLGMRQDTAPGRPAGFNNLIIDIGGAEFRISFPEGMRGDQLLPQLQRIAAVRFERTPNNVPHDAMAWENATRAIVPASISWTRRRNSALQNLDAAEKRAQEGIKLDAGRAAQAIRSAGGGTGRAGKPGGRGGSAQAVLAGRAVRLRRRCHKGPDRRYGETGRGAAETVTVSRAAQARRSSGG